MAVKIRLARHGKKNHAFFHIVVTDIRSPRDGRYIEQIGVYNPNTTPTPQPSRSTTREPSTGSVPVLSLLTPAAVSSLTRVSS